MSEPTKDESNTTVADAIYLRDRLAEEMYYGWNLADTLTGMPAEVREAVRQLVYRAKEKRMNASATFSARK